MERLYYVETENETAETSDRLEAARIAAEWKKRGYKVDTIVVDATDDAVRVAEGRKQEPAAERRRPPPVAGSKA